MLLVWDWTKSCLFTYKSIRAYCILLYKHTKPRIRQCMGLQQWAKSKIGHHCEGRNFFFQLSFLSSQKPRHFMYIKWINNHCTPQKHQRSAAMIKHVTIATHLKVRRTEFCSKIPSVAKIHFLLSCLSSCVILH